MTAQYPCHLTGTAWASCGNLAIAVQGPYDYRKYIRSSCDYLLQNDQLILRFCVRSPCGNGDSSYGDSSMLLRSVYGLRSYDCFFFFFFFVKFRVKQNRRGYDDPTTSKNHTISYGLLTEIARKWKFRHRTIVVSSSQAKCKLGI